MKQITLWALSIFIALPMHAQITIEASDFAFNPNPVEDTIFYWGFDKIQLSAPQFGADVFWDFSTLPLDGQTYRTVFESATHPDFPTATLRLPADPAYFGVPFSTFDYFTYDNTGLYLDGMVDPSFDFPLGSVTGNTADTISLIGGGRLGTEPRPVVTFPLIYGDSSTIVSYSSLNFIADVPSFGLNNAPITQSVKRTITSQVNGWGKVTLLNPTTQMVDTFETLLYYQVDVRVDSFYDAANNPVPNSLLNQVGFSQGESFTHEHFSFIIPGADYLAVYFYRLDGVWSTALCNKSVFTGATPVSTSDVASNAVHHRIYPNPVQNHRFQLEMDKNNAENWQLQIFDALGRVVHSEAVVDNVHTVQLDSSLPLGQYFYRLRRPNGQVMATGKLSKQ